MSELNLSPLPSKAVIKIEYVTASEEPRGKMSNAPIQSRLAQGLSYAGFLMTKGIVFVATRAHTPTLAPTAEDHTHTVDVLPTPL